MRLFRLALAYAACLALWFDLATVVQIHVYGFPPDHTIEFTPDGRMVLAPSTDDQVQYGLFLLAVGLAQAFVFRLTWKAWRR